MTVFPPNRFKIFAAILSTLIFVCCFSLNSLAQNSEAVAISAETFAERNSVDLSKQIWKYRFGDDLNFAQSDFDDANWDKIEGTTLKPEMLGADWRGRAWFRLYLNISENAVGKNLALSGTQRGASEVFADGQKIAEFGEITDTQISEYNPNNLPIFVKFDAPGRHVLAIRFGSETFAAPDSGKSQWLINGGIFPGFAYSLRAADDAAEVVAVYASQSAMRFGFLFFGVLFALALLHFLLYIFYRVERANLFYSIYAATLGFFILFNNFISFGHQPVFASTVLKVLSSMMFVISFTSLLAFLHVAFGRRIGKLFWMFTLLWAIHLILIFVLLNNLGIFTLLTNIMIGLTFTFSILILVQALREKRSGAWILMAGIQILMLGMTLTLLRSLRVINISELPTVLSDLAIVLGVPVSVSVFLARNFARTNRDLKTQLVQVEELSAHKIEQEREAAALRAENERRAKELEEARQLQLSLLPKKLPQIENLEIAAYMKPATEVGGDYYDFYLSKDGTLTVAVGDATGHGLKAGSVVTATKSLFNAFAEQSDIPQILAQTSGALKRMNLRGLFMAMAMLKIKDNRVNLSIAGMPAALIYRKRSKSVEEIAIRAVPLGSLAKTNYREQQIELIEDDVVVLMSDGFPEMFNKSGEMLGFEKAAEVLPQIADLSPQEIIDHLVKIGEDWANGRPQDDDVTFVVMKITGSENRTNI